MLKNSSVFAFLCFTVPSIQSFSTLFSGGKTVFRKNKKLPHEIKLLKLYFKSINKIRRTRGEERLIRIRNP